MNTALTAFCNHKQKHSWCSVFQQPLGTSSRFDAEHGVQEVVGASDVSRDEAVTLQKDAVLRRRSLFPFAHAQSLQQPTARTASVFIQEDLAQQESTAWNREGQEN